MSCLYGILYLGLNEVHPIIPHHLDRLEDIDSILVNYLGDALKNSTEDCGATYSIPGNKKINRVVSKSKTFLPGYPNKSSN